MAISPILLIGLICLASSGSPFVEAIWLTVPSSGERCVHEKIQANVVAILSYICIDQEHVGIGPTVDIQVSSPPGNVVYKKTNESHGEFLFTTSEMGTYLTCLSMHHDQSHYAPNITAIISIDWRIGIATKDWDSVAKKEHIKGVDLALRKSKEVVGAIRSNLFYLQIREAYMKEINDKTNKRVAQLSFISLGVSFVVSLFQIWNLKRFFINKKLI